MDKYTFALTKLLENIGEGKRESELTSAQKRLVKSAEKFGYVGSRRINGDWIIYPTGRMP